MPIQINSDSVKSSYWEFIKREKMLHEQKNLQSKIKSLKPKICSDNLFFHSSPFPRNELLGDILSVEFAGNILVPCCLVDAFDCAEYLVRPICSNLLYRCGIEHVHKRIGSDSDTLRDYLRNLWDVDSRIALLKVETIDRNRVIQTDADKHCSGPIVQEYIRDGYFTFPERRQALLDGILNRNSEPGYALEPISWILCKFVTKIDDSQKDPKPVITVDSFQVVNSNFVQLFYKVFGKEIDETLEEADIYTRYMNHLDCKIKELPQDILLQISN